MDQYTINDLLIQQNKIKDLQHELNSLGEGVRSFEGFKILYYINQGIQFPSQLGELIHCSYPAISRKVNNLVDNNLLKKNYGLNQDQRKVQLTLTPYGLDLLKRVTKKYEIWCQQHDEFFFD